MAQRKPDLKLSERLLAMMDAHRPVIRQARLARDVGVSGTTIIRWMRQLDAGTLDEESWARMATVLRDKYQLATEEIRPIRVAVPNPTSGVVLDDSLLAELDHFDEAEAVEALIRILSNGSSQAARDLLLVVARDRLRLLKQRK